MSQNREKKRKFDIPIWRKANLSIEEAAAYSGIGMAKLYEMTESEDCPFVLWMHGLICGVIPPMRTMGTPSRFLHLSCNTVDSGAS